MVTRKSFFLRFMERYAETLEGIEESDDEGEII